VENLIIEFITKNSGTTFSTLEEVFKINRFRLGYITNKLLHDEKIEKINNKFYLLKQK